MLRKLAVALVAATMLTAPALAQGTSDTKTGTKTGTAPAATASPAAPKVVTAKPSLKSAKVKSGRHYASHRTHVRHVAHVKPEKYMRAATSTEGDKPVAKPVTKPVTKPVIKHATKHQVRHVAHKPATGTYTDAAGNPKPKSGTN
jgi:hypothetical protein